jgi:BirA family biotin operon repressor/biotin-[acetyl-CoA-carboxylase] ligase
VLRLLYARGDAYFPMDELAERAGVSLSNVQRAMAELRQRGHSFEQSPGLGVRLCRPIRPDAAIIEPALTGRRIGRSVICFDEVGSTNDVAADSSRHGDADGLVVLAESQRQGRGRLGRRWQAQPGTAVLMSVVLIDRAGELSHEALTVAAGEAVAHGAHQACGVQCELKWPNDVLVEGAKLAGVLVETRRVGQGRCVVIGMGINVGQAPQAASVGRAATCLSQHAGHPVERVDVACSVLARLDDWVRQIAAGQTGALHDCWMRQCGMIARRASIMSGGRSFSGVVLDVSPLEGLVLQLDGGARVLLPAETSSVLE